MQSTGSESPVPRGSKPTMSKSSRSTSRNANDEFSAYDVPGAPGPPGLTTSEPTRLGRVVGRVLEQRELDRLAARVLVVDGHRQRGALEVARGTTPRSAPGRRTSPRSGARADRWRRARRSGSAASVGVEAVVVAGRASSSWPRGSGRPRTRTTRHRERRPRRIARRSVADALIRAARSGAFEGDHHRLQREGHRDIELQHLLACGEDRRDPPQVQLRGRGPGDLLDVAADLLVDQRARRRRCASAIASR